MRRKPVRVDLPDFSRPIFAARGKVKGLVLLVAGELDPIRGLFKGCLRHHAARRVRMLHVPQQNKPQTARIAPSASGDSELASIRGKAQRCNTGKTGAILRIVIARLQGAGRIVCLSG